MRVGWGAWVLGLLLTAGTAAAAEPSPARDVAIYVYPEDSGASAMAARTQDTLARAAARKGFRSASDTRAAELLDRSSDDLQHAWTALDTAASALKEAQDELGRVRLDAAQDALLRANAALLDAAAAPSYSMMRDVHLYLGIVALQQGQPDTAHAQFRAVLFFSPGYQINRNAFPPSVVNAFEQARASIATGRKGTVRVEADREGALLLVDGVLKGSIPREVTDLPEGTHYLEVRGPNIVPQLLPVQVQGGAEKPVLAATQPTGAPMRKLWSQPQGETGAAAIAKILGVDRLVVAAVRTTVAGVSPFAVRGAAFDQAHRTTTAEIATSRDVASTDLKLQRFSDELFRETPRRASTSEAALAAARNRFFAPYELRVGLESGVAVQDHYFDSQGKSQLASDYGQVYGGDPDHGFDQYAESRTVLHVRYGLRERTTVFVDVPFYAKHLKYDYDDNFNGTIEPDEQGLKRDDQGVGDVVLGADVRLPAAEGLFSLVYATAHAKLATGNADAGGFLRQYRHLALGTGQNDLYAGIGGALAAGPVRIDGEAGYTLRIPDPVPYFETNRVLNVGDEQHVHLDGAAQMAGRWLAGEVGVDLTHRNATHYFVDPFTHQLGRTREMTMLNASAALRAEFSERVDGGVVVEYPVWGKSTITFFPLDVTGPRAYLYYGVRF